MYDKAEKRALQKLDIELYISAEADEMWSFVQRKKQQRWLWYVLDRATKSVLAFVFGTRTDEIAKQLADLLPKELRSLKKTKSRATTCSDSSEACPRRAGAGADTSRGCNDSHVFFCFIPTAIHIG